MWQQQVGSINKSPQALLPFWSGFKLNLYFSCVPLTRSLHCTVLPHFMASDHKSNILAKFASTRATFYLISMNLRKTVRGQQKISTYRMSHLPKIGCIIPFAHSKNNNHFYLMEKYSKCMIIIKPWLSTWAVIIKMEMSRCSAIQSQQSGKSKTQHTFNMPGDPESGMSVWEGCDRIW